MGTLGCVWFQTWSSVWLRSLRWIGRWEENDSLPGRAASSVQLSLVQNAQRAGKMCGVRHVYMYIPRVRQRGKRVGGRMEVPLEIADCSGQLGLAQRAQRAGKMGQLISFK